MITTGKVSMVAVCPQCNNFVLACHVQYLTMESERQFAEAKADGFKVKLETIRQTQKRNLSLYNDCLKHNRNK